ncbi:uncharacterized [Tachysurus ichikawai]
MQCCRPKLKIGSCSGACFNMGTPAVILAAQPTLLITTMGPYNYNEAFLEVFQDINRPDISSETTVENGCWLNNISWQRITWQHTQRHTSTCFLLSPPPFCPFCFAPLLPGSQKSELEVYYSKHGTVNLDFPFPNTYVFSVSPTDVLDQSSGGKIEAWADLARANLWHFEGNAL